MKRHVGLSARVAAGIALSLALSVSTSCFYFDPLNPFERGGTEFYTWEKYFGGWDIEIGYSVQPTTDYGYIIAGYTGTFGGPEYLLLIKTDNFGNQQWSKTFGGEGQNRGHCVRQTSDGGYIITGTTEMHGGNGGNDVWLIKTLPNGGEEWSKTFGGSGDDEGWCVRSTADGGYIVVGTTSSFGAGVHDVYLIKTLADGTEEWSTTFGDIYSDRGYSVRQFSDGGYIIAGSTQATAPPYDDNAYLIKTDASGIEEWSAAYGTLSDLDDGGTCAHAVHGGGWILVGYTHATVGGDSDAWMIKTDYNGVEEWNTIFGGPEQDRADSVQQTIDGGYVIAGMTKSFGSNEQAWLIKTGVDGTEEWSVTFGGDGNDGALHAEQGHGGYIITGYSNSSAGGPDVYLIQYVP